MKSQQFSSLGLNINLLVPETAKEFNELAVGHPAKDPCLAEAINNVVYRGSLADFRRVHLDAVEKITGVERETEPVLDDKGKPKTKKATVIEVGPDGTKTEKTVEEEVLRYKDTEGRYFNKVWSKLNVESEVFAPLAQLVVDGVQTKDGEGNLVIPDDRRNRLAAIITSLSGDLEVLEEVAGIIGTGIAFDASATPREPAQPKKTAKVYLDAAAKLIADGHGEMVAAKLSQILGQTFTPTQESLGKAIQLHEAKKRAEAQKQIAANYAALVSNVQ